jgi:hypothetical protein
MGFLLAWGLSKEDGYVPVRKRCWREKDVDFLTEERIKKASRSDLRRQSIPVSW